MTITIPELSLVVLVGASGSGKSTFARRHFRATEIVSSDWCRGAVCDDETNQAASRDAFDLLGFIAAKRLAAGRLTIIDATNVQADARKPLVALARQLHCLPVAIVLNVSERTCLERNRARPDRDIAPHVVRRQVGLMRRSVRSLKTEGFRHIHVLAPETIESVQVQRQPLWNDRRNEHGPFDIIGDVHGCREELESLLSRLGYGVVREEGAAGPPKVIAPAGRRAIFLGDLVDRGPDVAGVLRLVMAMVAEGSALCLPGNHEIKLMRALRGQDVKVSHGLAESLAQVGREPEEFRAAIVAFIDGLVSHFVFDDGRLVVAHAGLKESMQGRASSAVRSFALYGETTGETDEYGLPVRFNWAAEYRGRALVVYGHTPVVEPEWLNNTLCIDTGCVFGGRLTALRYPEKEVVSVPAARTYFEPLRPLAAPAAARLTSQQQHDDVLHLEDVLGKRIVTTGLHRTVTIREENAAAALEAMSRWAADPKWIIYLPPTMSPPETSGRPGLLEHPEEAFAYFRRNGVVRVVCEEKHMGSRAVVIVCREPGVSRARFGVLPEEPGICYTRTGRRFFPDASLERELLERLGRALDATGFWEEHRTDWALLDAELMPWSVKAGDLIRDQYASVAAAARASLAEAAAALTAAAGRGVPLDGLERRLAARIEDVERYAAAYRSYCRPVRSLSDLRLAPFHLLATEGHVHAGRTHVWHLETLAAVCRHDPDLLVATPFRVVDLDDEAGRQAGAAWWEEITARGAEGMVVKPMEFVSRGPKGLIQPAVKCRGPEYLRIIYGPEYLAEENLARLRSRGLSAKRALALGEFALGVEGLERFVRREPLRRTHECVFGVLALESEPVDPRL